MSRAGGGYRPKFVGSDPAARRVAARVIGTYQGHVGEPRRALTDALDALERSVGPTDAVGTSGADGTGETGDADGAGGASGADGTSAASVVRDADETSTVREPDAYKLVRGFASLLDREATFETRAPLPPDRARRAAFAAAERVGVADAESRERALALAGEQLGTDATAVEASLYADREAEQTLTAFDSRWDPRSLCRQYDLSLAATALFDATEIRVRSSDPKRLVSAVKRHGLCYEIRLPDEHAPGDRVAFDVADGATPVDSTDTADDADTVNGESAGSPTLSDRVVIVTGPDALFRRTRRYGTAFAATLRTLARSVARWEVEATIDDRGTERELRLTNADVPVPETAPVAEPGFDSGVERDFARRFRALDLDWTLRREPEPLATTVDGRRQAMIPDFAFEYAHADFRVYFEVMGFWTPAYVAKKLAQLDGLEHVAMIVAVDESLGVGEELAARDARVVPYSGTVSVKRVVNALREFENAAAARATDDLPATLTPDERVARLDRVADRYGVPTDALRDVSFPDHERVGSLLVHPRVLNAVASELEPGMAYETVERVLADHDLPDASAVLAELGYRVEWSGLEGGTLRRVE